MFPSYPPLLRQGDVHLWYESLDIPSDRLLILYNYLSLDEKERVSRFRFQKDRSRFIASRGKLREILGNYLDCDPTGMVFDYTAFKKPYLSDDSHQLNFNVSYSREKCLIAVTRDRRIGIDIEYEAPIGHLMDCVKKAFSPFEISRITSLPEENRLEAFYRCWTRKEAFTKALGEGLSFPFQRFDVSLDLTEPARLLRLENDEDAPSRWTIVDLGKWHGYTAALAIEAKEITIMHLRCTSAAVARRSAAPLNHLACFTA